ncbi:hypothetical protein [Sphingomonas sp. PAMC 26605]|uniref:hypothetical protein n=1 Tax=Sphingomonas sp. PAMC 26605 TaxID=1112214 RepID=UPI00026CA629|nr:hypothetical protein [Sphingomonas sp. PAMC 26605]
MIAALLLLSQAAAPAAAATPAPWAVQARPSGKTIATSSSAWSSDNSARLVVRCDTTGDRVVSLQFIPKAGFVAALPRPVSINVDDGGWFGTNWQFPGSGAFISDDVVVTNLTTMIAAGKSIRVRVIDPDNKPVDAVFAGPGPAPIRQVLAACGYELGKAPARAGVPVKPAPTDPAAKKAPDPDEE